MKRRILCAMVLLLGWGAAGHLAAVERVALLNIVSEDNSHRSTLAANSFTAALQALLTPDGTWEWVERAALSRVEDEFKLTGLGLIDRGEALRSGRWLKADWGILGHIATNMVTGRKLTLEVVNLDRAELLAATNVMLVSASATHLRLQDSHLSTAAAALRGCMDRARQVELGLRGKQKIAFLFLAPAGLGSRAGAVLEQDFRAALQQAAADQPVHLLQFQRPGDAMSEANLVLTGLAQADPEAWRKVADYYLWGRFTWREQRRMNRTTREWQKQTNLVITVEVWDGRSALQQVTLPLTNIASTVVAAQAAAAGVMPLLRARAEAPVVESVRQNVAASLVAYAGELAQAHVTFSPTDNEGVQKWLQVVEVLETACFFDPGNALARELWARVRWSRRAEQASANEFFFARRRSEAWGRHVEQFGYVSVCPPPPAGGWWGKESIAAEHVLSAWRPYEMFKFSQYNQAAWGVPRDAGASELFSWQREFGRELYQRLGRAPADEKITALTWDLLYGLVTRKGSQFVMPEVRERQRCLDLLWPRIITIQRQIPARFDEAYLAGLRAHYVELGQPGGERAWLAQLDDIAREHTTRARNQPVVLPRADSLDAPNPTTK